MVEYKFKIFFTHNHKKLICETTVETTKGFDTAISAALKKLFSEFPTANNIHWKLL